jgi:clathrin heavy chain
MSNPINSTEVLSFQQLNMDPQFASISNTALSNDKWLCVREVTQTESNVVIIDLQNGNNVTRHKMKADAAVMHPTRNVIALRGSNVIQIFDLGQRAKLKSYALPEGVVVNYWRWIDDDTLAFVAGTGVFHWSLSVDQPPVGIFQLQPAVSSGSVMNYCVSHDQQWLAVFALTREDNGAPAGKIQLYSKERNMSQVIDAFTAGFAHAGDLPLLVFVTHNPTNKVNIIPLGNSPSASQFGRRQFDLPTAPDAADDLPLQLVISPKYSTAFILTRMGFLYLVEVETPYCYLSARVSATSFIHASLCKDGSVLALTREGRMSKFQINDSVIVDYIARRGNPQVAAKIAGSANLTMSGDFVNQQFDQYLQMGNYQEAARLATQNNSLRNQATVQKLLRLPVVPGQPAPVLIYFSTMLDMTKLNEVESIELCRIVLQQQKIQLIEKWIKEDKLTMTEELGDLCKQSNTRIALAIYLRANVSAKIVASFAELGSFDKVQSYCQKYNYTPNWMQTISIVIRTAPNNVEPLLEHLANKGQPLVDVRQVVQMLMQYQLVKAAIAFLINVLVTDREEDSDLQTMLFEITLNNQPKIAEELFNRECFTFYDRQKVAALCERAGNFMRALDHYTDLPSIKRCIVHTDVITTDFLVNYFQSMTSDWAIECLRELLLNSHPGSNNVQIVVQIAAKYWEKIGIDTLIKLFTDTNSSEGIYYFLAQVVNTCTDPDIHFRYIEAALKLQNFNEVERMCQESQYLQPERVRDFLMQADIPDPIPLIVLCDRFEFVEDLTKYLYKKQKFRELETYAQQFTPRNAGKVIGALIDIEAPNDLIVRLINSVQHTAPIGELIEQTMKRERLKLLEPILLQRQQTGSVDPDTNNGIVLLAVQSNRNPEKVLNENQYYDPKYVGDVLSKRDAHLAFIAYSHGNCDDEVIALTNTHQLYKEQARYCVYRQSDELWARVLSPENEHMKLVVDAVIATALPECDDPDKVSKTVQAFIAAQIPTQLLGLLEKVVMESPQFQNNTSLQNLLIITAIKSDTSRVMTYVTRLNDYTWDQICDRLIQAQLYDEAIAAYKKFNQNVEAVRVMLDYKQNLQEATDWASHCNDPSVFSELARAQLGLNQIVEAIDSFIKAKDTKDYANVIQRAEAADEYKALVGFLELARQIQNRDPMIETELCFAYAKMDMLAELEGLVSSPNSARVKDIADRCFDQQLYKACKILYANIKDYTRLTETLLNLKEFQNAIDAAGKAGTTSAWKAVNKACVLDNQFALAQRAGLQVVIVADQLDEIIDLYETHGFFNEIIQLLESALNLERAHGGIFTNLTCLYAKYQPEKCLDHLKQCYERVALFKVIKVLLQMHMWNELTFAYEKYNEIDNAINTMMQHPTMAWNHAHFKDLIAQISNPDILYRSINFYLTYDPKEVEEVLGIIGPKVDATRVVDTFKRSGNLQLIKKWLASIQSNNVQAVNEALNQMYIDDGDYESLRRSIDQYDLFDQITLARSLQNHECLEFRRISSYLYRRAQRWNEAIDLSKKDKLYRDVIETASQSRQPEVAISTLKFFVENKLFECFAATTFVCYDLLSADVVLELAWRAQSPDIPMGKQCMDFAMPFLIQSLREQNSTILQMKQEMEDLKGKLNETKEVAAAAASASVPPAGFVSAPAFPDTDPFANSAPQPEFNQFPSNNAFGSQNANPFGNQPNQMGFPNQQNQMGFPNQQNQMGFPNQQNNFPNNAFGDQNQFNNNNMGFPAFPN